jgi:hypothetical protein
VADITNLSQFLGDIADAIRTKKDTSASIPAAEFDTEILSIVTGTNTDDADAVAENIEAGKTAYVKGEKVTGTLGNAGGSADIMVPSDNVTVGNERGWDCISTKYTNSGKKIYKDGWYVNQHIKFEDLAPKLGVTPEKIVSGETILGVEGNAEGGGSGGGDITDATATANDILYPKVAYTNSGRTVGEISATYGSSKPKSVPYRIIHNSSISMWDVSYSRNLVVINNGSSSFKLAHIVGGEIDYNNTVTHTNSAIGTSYSIISVQIAPVMDTTGDTFVLWTLAVTGEGNRSYSVTRSVFNRDTLQLLSTKTTNYSDGGYYTNQYCIRPRPNYDTDVAVLVGHNSGLTGRIRYKIIRFNTASNSFTQKLNDYAQTRGANYFNTVNAFGYWTEDGGYFQGETDTNAHIRIYKVDNACNVSLFYSSSTYRRLLNGGYYLQGSTVYNMSGTSVGTSVSNFSSNDTVLQLGNLIFLQSGTTTTVYRLTDECNIEKYTTITTGTATRFLEYNHTFLYDDKDGKLAGYTTGTEKHVTSFQRNEVNYYDTTDSTATLSNVLNGKTFYNKDGKQSGTMVNNGYLEYPVSKETRSIPAGYTSGGIVEGVTADVDANITPDNIKKGVTILDVEGTYEPEGGDDTSDANIQAKYLLEGYSAVSDGKLIEGTMKNRGYVTMNWTSEEQEIPCGYYDELYIPRADASNLDGYEECSTALQYVLTGKLVKFEELNYIRSNGSQGIDTGILCQDTITMQVKFSTAVHTGSCYFGAGTGNEADSFRFFSADNPAKWYLDYGSGESYNRISGGTPELNTVYELEIGNRYIKDLTTGNNITSGSSVSFSDKTYPIQIAGSGSHLDIYYCKIYNNGELVRDYVPMIRNTDLAVGLYDNVEKQFYINMIGTTNFISGGVKQ